MQRLRFLDTLGVACALLCASHLLVVQNGFACSWHAELFDYTTQETTHFSVDETPVKIPIVQGDKGVDVHCSLDPSEVLSIGILKQQKVDIAHSIGFSGGQLSSYVEGSSALDFPLIHDARSQDPS